MEHLFVSVPDSTTRDLIGEVPDGVEIIQWDLASPPPRPKIDMVVTHAFATPEALAATAEVETRLVQVQAIGFDTILDCVPAGKVVANGHSVHETATAELTLAVLLAELRGVPRMVRQQDESRWERYWTPGLADANVLMIGSGSVGRAIADRLAPFEVKLTRVATTARDDERGHVHATSELPALLPEADVVIVIVPLTPDTDGMVDDAFLSRMKDGAVFLNVARGRVARTDALIAHADRLRIVVDVVDPEPLPSDSPLWQKAALIAPHLGGMTDALAPRLGQLMRRQIDHLLAGEEPENIVIRTDGK